MSSRFFARFLIFIFLIGILNGSISSGTGLLVTILLIKTFEMDFLRAISMTFFTVGIFWNFVGAVFLARIGSIPLNLLMALIIGSFTGGYFGAHLSKLNGNIRIKISQFTYPITLIQLISQHRFLSLSFERFHASQKLINSDPESIDISPVIKFPAVH